MEIWKVHHRHNPTHEQGTRAIGALSGGRLWLLRRDMNGGFSFVATRIHDDSSLTMDEDYYKILEISRSASQAEIQKAYRELARKYHPDLNPDNQSAKERFQKVQLAFDVLNDSKKRELYDRYGSAFESMGAGGPGRAPGGGGGWPPGGGAGYEGVDFSQFFGEKYGAESASPFGDIFSQFTRGGQPSRRGPAAPTRGNDIQSNLQIPFQTAVTGGEAQISVRRHTGKVETITVKIPPGIESGKKIRLRGQGETGSGSNQPGDILITVSVASHPLFQRTGARLDVRVPVTLAEAVLGAKVDVPTPRGVVTVTVPPGSSSGTRLKIKGQGVKPRNAPSGDLFAELQIVLPEKLDDAALDAIRQIDEANPCDPRADLKW